MADKELVERLLAGVDAWNKWRGQDETDLDLWRADLKGADLSGAQLRGVHLGGADLSGANLKLTDLTRADLNKANLERANLSESDLIEAILHSTNLTNANLEKVHLIGANLSQAILIGADLNKGELSDAEFSRANLRNANLSRANLSRASLVGADLSEANLRTANLTKTDLSYANLNSTALENAHLSLARLIRTDMTDATVDGANVTDTQVHELLGQPKPPTHVFVKNNRIEGQDAAAFFIQLERVEIVLDKPMSQQAIGAYYVFIGDCAVHNQLPESFAFLGGRVDGGTTILSYQALSSDDITRFVGTLLQPFAKGPSINIPALLRDCSVNEAESQVTDLVADPIFRSMIGAKLRESVEYSASPMELVTPSGRARITFDENASPQIEATGQLTVGVQVIKGDPNMSKNDHSTNLNAGNNLNVTNSVVGTEAKARDIITTIDNAESTEANAELLAALKSAIEELANLSINEKDKADAMDDFGKLVAEVQEEKPEGSRVERLWGNVKRVVGTASDGVETFARIQALLAPLIGG